MYISTFGKCARGFAAGFIIAFMCFELLPQAFDENRVLYGILGLVIGTAFAIIVENLKFLKPLAVDIFNMALGCLICFLSFGLEGKVFSFLLTFAAGEIIYVCCGMILPNGSYKATVLFAILGFAAAVMFF